MISPVTRTEWPEVNLVASSFLQHSVNTPRNSSISPWKQTTCGSWLSPNAVRLADVASLFACHTVDLNFCSMNQGRLGFRKCCGWSSTIAILKEQRGTWRHGRRSLSKFLMKLTSNELQVKFSQISISVSKRYLWKVQVFRSLRIKRRFSAKYHLQCWSVTVTTNDQESPAILPPFS